MKLRYLSGCTFLITSDAGVRIIVDPFQHNYVPDNPPPGDNPERAPVGEFADIVTMSHTHFNYSYIYGVKGVPLLYTGGAPVEMKGIKFSGAIGWHYTTGMGDGPQGTVSMVGIEVDGIRIRHMGDYGQPELTAEQVAQIGRVDILLTRWLDWSLGLIAQLKPKVVIPMHADRPDAAMTSLKGLTQKDVSEMEFKASTLPRELQCILLKAERGD